MSFSVLERLRRRVGFQLSLWYVLLFTLSNVALFALTYYLLAAAIQNRERVLLEARLQEAARLYESGGVGAVREWMQSQPPKLQKSLFVRLVSETNSVTIAQRAGGLGDLSRTRPANGTNTGTRRMSSSAFPRTRKKISCSIPPMLPDGIAAANRAQHRPIARRCCICCVTVSSWSAA